MTIRSGQQGMLSRRASLMMSSLVFVGILVLWWGASHASWSNPMFLPSPERVLARLQVWASDGPLVTDIWISVYRVSAAFVLAAAMALPLGILAGHYPLAQALIQPLMEFSRYLPAVAFVPLVLLWVGIDESAKITIIWIGTFFQMVLMIADDVRRVPRAQIESALTLGARPMEVLWRVVVRSALPDIINTLRITLGWAWTYLVVAELVASNSGLGFAILRAQKFMQTDTIFAGILLIGVLGLLMDVGMRLIHRYWFPWLYPGGGS
jgi:NitT/TauT family transport system permease protein